MDDNKTYEEAREKVHEMRGFYHHLIWYVIINLLLLFINLVTSPGALWFYWVTIFWGIGLFAHALGVFSNFRIMGKDWEKKKIEQIMEKDKK